MERTGAASAMVKAVQGAMKAAPRHSVGCVPGGRGAVRGQSARVACPIVRGRLVGAEAAAAARQNPWCGVVATATSPPDAFFFWGVEGRLSSSRLMLSLSAMSSVVICARSFMVIPHAEPFFLRLSGCAG